MAAVNFGAIIAARMKSTPSLLNSSIITAIFINIILDSFSSQPVNSAFILFQSPVSSYSIIICFMFMDALLSQILNYTSSLLSLTSSSSSSCPVKYCTVPFSSSSPIFPPWRSSPVPASARNQPLMPWTPPAAPEPLGHRRPDHCSRRPCVIVIAVLIGVCTFVTVVG